MQKEKDGGGAEEREKNKKQKKMNLGKEFQKRSNVNESVMIMEERKSQYGRNESERKQRIKEYMT